MFVTRKLLLAATASILFVHGVDALLRFDRERALFAEDLARDAQEVGRTAAAALEVAWSNRGEAGARAMLERIAAESPNTVFAIEPWRDEAPPSGADEAPQPDLATIRVPIRSDRGPMATLLVEVRFMHQTQYLRASAARAATAALTTVAVTVAVVAALGFWLVRRPLASLVGAAARIGGGDLDTHVLARTNDEIGDLGRAMETMRGDLSTARRAIESEARARLSAELRADLERRQREELTAQLRHADRLATAGTLVSTVMHEIGAPLQVISGRAKMIAQRAADAAKVTEYAGMIREQADRIATLGRAFLGFTRKGERGEDRCSLRDTVTSALEMLGPIAQRRKVEIEVGSGLGDRQVRMAPDRLSQVLTNLAMNAFDAMKEGGTLRVTAETAAAGRRLTLVVTDTGSGMTADVQHRIFTPFFTTKPAGEGTGLGLSVVDGIVREAGGTIRVESAPGNGTTFRIDLDVADDVALGDRDT